jgi:hypothetical protein
MSVLVIFPLAVPVRQRVARVILRVHSMIMLSSCHSPESAVLDAHICANNLIFVSSISYHFSAKCATGLISD